MSSGRAARDDAVVWHDVECAGYDADLGLWSELAGAHPGALLDLGAGTGRVALHLAALGHDVWALDAEPALVRALAARARARGLAVRVEVGDVRTLALATRFALVIAPMQVVQLLGGADGRLAMLARVWEHLRPGGVLALALADPFEGLQTEWALPPLPDVREEDGWVFSSTPIALRPEAGATAIDRLRQAVSPAGELSESLATIRLDDVGPEAIEAAAAKLGFAVLGRREVPETDAYVGSTIVVLRRRP